MRKNELLLSYFFYVIQCSCIERNRNIRSLSLEIITWMDSHIQITFIHIRCTKIVDFFILTFIANWNRTPQPIAWQPAQKCCSKCITRNLAHLQAHEVSEASESWTCSNTPTKVPAGNLCVSQQQQNYHFLKSWEYFWNFDFHCDFCSLFFPFLKCKL